MRRSRVVGVVVGVVFVAVMAFVIRDVSKTKICGAHCDADQVVVTFTPNTTVSQANAVRATCVPVKLAVASPVSTGEPLRMVVTLRYSANQSNEHPVFSCLRSDPHVASAAVPV